jgi:DtxR family Mn-dependent transcriptional regulator
VLAERLGLSPGTITATVKRLADRGLVDHKPYRGVELTKPGRQAAIAAIRRHRIVERFLADMLGYAWNEADRLATSFEHDIPQEVEDRLFVALDRPEACPHGFPIPAKETADLPLMPPLYALEPGDTAVVAVPGSTDPEIVAFLDTLGLRPGVIVEVKEKHPFDGPLVLRVDGKERTLGATVANQVYVQKSA